MNGIMDGPLLDGWRSSSNPIKKYASKQENEFIRKSMADTQIDLVVKLDVDSETSSQDGENTHSKWPNHKTGILGDL